MRSLVKDTDGFMARHVERPISLQISRALAGTAITPNQMSLISIAVGICGGPFFLSVPPADADDRSAPVSCAFDP